MPDREFYFILFTQFFKFFKNQTSRRRLYLIAIGFRGIACTQATGLWKQDSNFVPYLRAYWGECKNVELLSINAKPGVFSYISPIFAQIMLKDSPFKCIIIRGRILLAKEVMCIFVPAPNFGSDRSVQISYWKYLLISRLLGIGPSSAQIIHSACHLKCWPGVSLFLSYWPFPGSYRSHAPDYCHAATSCSPSRKRSCPECAW